MVLLPAFSMQCIVSLRESTRRRGWKTQQSVVWGLPALVHPIRCHQDSDSVPHSHGCAGRTMHAEWRLARASPCSLSGFAFGKTPELDTPTLFVPQAASLALGEERWAEVVPACALALQALSSPGQPPGWDCLCRVPELRPALPEARLYARGLSFEGFALELERAREWSLQRATKNTLREAVQYLAAAGADLLPAAAPAAERVPPAARAGCPEPVVATTSWPCPSGSRGAAASQAGPWLHQEPLAVTAAPSGYPELDSRAAYASVYGSAAQSTPRVRAAPPLQHQRPHARPAAAAGAGVCAAARPGACGTRSA
ncbi:unnamed protein product [Prorocentrum cordatum]|uniref:Uncharacterized protein n=1 Tax=Prorocentrum cordatum TaxID=2364126 RepID=A0ABN9QF49_9DINO|nr:unnamed protein product [Polarella glacialis]